MNRKTISSILIVISVYMPYFTLELILFALYEYWLDWFYLLLMATLLTGLTLPVIAFVIEPKEKKKEKEQENDL